MTANGIPFDKESWDQLPSLLEYLPEPVQLHLWCDENGSKEESEAFRLVSLLSENFKLIDFQLFPRRANFSYYPVFAVMGLDGGEPVDHGLRILGLPIGYQMTSLIAAIQSVSFRGMTSEALSRIRLAQLKEELSIELITDGEDESGPVIAQIIFNFAVFSSYIKSYVIMGSSFPEAYVRYSVKYLPHLVINERYHLEGVISEAQLVEEISKFLKSE